MSRADRSSEDKTTENMISAPVDFRYGGATFQLDGRIERAEFQLIIENARWGAQSPGRAR